MKILLVTNYWYPYNNPGALRWLGFGKYINFDVLTCKKPTRGFKDYSMPNHGHKTIRFGYKIPAVIWGVLSLIPLLFMRYDVYIITSPPESLLFTAWVLQLFKRKVIVDMRDSIDRKAQPHKFLNKFYKHFYKKCKIKFVAFKIIDINEMVVYHGYDDLKLSVHDLKNPIYYSGHVDYQTYNDFLVHGIIPDFSKKPKGYVSSSAHNVIRLGYKINQQFHDEEYGVYSWEDGAKKILKLINQ